MQLRTIAIVLLVLCVTLLTSSCTAAAAIETNETRATAEEDSRLLNDTQIVAAYGRYCPHGFTYISSVKSCYAVVRRNLEWSMAGLTCRSLHRNAHLVIINHAREQQALASLLQHTDIYAVCYAERGCFASGSSGVWFWTAGQRVDPSRASGFIWRTSTNPCDDAESLMTYTNWYSGEPNYGRHQESCMHLWSGQSYTWNDAPCTWAVCSVCELERRNI